LKRIWGSLKKTAVEINRIVMDLSGWKEQYETYIEELERGRETQKSLTDPDSRLMVAQGKVEVCYTVQRGETGVVAVVDDAGYDRVQDIVESLDHGVMPHISWGGF
jgi:hypothetical protein